MKRKLLPMFILSWIILFFAASALASSDVPKKKQTVLGLYLTAKEAFSRWHVDSDKVVVLDGRTPEEYIFVGHAPMARNIPVRIFNQQLTAKNRKPAMEPNPDFVPQVRRDYQVSDTILVMCRSGAAAPWRSIFWRRLDSRMYTISQTDSKETQSRTLRATSTEEE